MAASLMGIMALVWVNMTNSTKPKPMGPSSKQNACAQHGSGGTIAKQTDPLACVVAEPTPRIGANKRVAACTEVRMLMATKPKPNSFNQSGK